MYFWFFFLSLLIHFVKEITNINAENPKRNPDFTTRFPHQRKYTSKSMTETLWTDRVLSEMYLFFVNQILLP